MFGKAGRTVIYSARWSARDDREEAMVNRVLFCLVIVCAGILPARAETAVSLELVTIQYDRLRCVGFLRCFFWLFVGNLALAVGFRILRHQHQARGKGGCFSRVFGSSSNWMCLMKIMWVLY